MDTKIKELIAVGAAIGANCLPCLEWHHNKCMELGIPEKDIKIAVEIGKAVKERPARDISELADKLLNKNTPSCACSQNGGCCANI